MAQFYNFTAPSIKTLTEHLKIDLETARRVRKLIKAESPELVDSHPAVVEWVSRCYHEPPYIDRLLCALDSVLGTYGVKGLDYDGSSPYCPDWEYLNAGDTYEPTLLFKRDGNLRPWRGVFRVGTWGDIAERLPSCD